jgi:cytochrome c peroxidase
MRRLIAVLICLLMACAGPDPDVVAGAPAGLSDGDLVRFLHGRDLFFNETFGGNGRTCSSCHLRRNIAENFDFSPADAQAIFAEDPTNPLFRAIDSDDGAGADYGLLLNHALAHIPLTLPANITVDETSSPLVRHNADGTTTVVVFRSTPTVENIALEENIMWDGRFHHSLHDQAIGAVNTHYQPTRQPTDVEANDIGFFQDFAFTQLSTAIFAAGGPAPTLPTVPAGVSHDSARRGRNFFVSMAVVPGAPVRGGHCATCHSGPMLDTTNAFNPVQQAGQQRTNNFVSEVNAPSPVFPPGTRFGIGLPELTYRITLLHPVFMPDGIPFPIPPGTPLFPPGLTFTVRSSDLGTLYTTGDPCEAPLACLINSDPTTGRLGTVSFFKTPTLWGTADSAPYFHNNSADQLEDVLEHYQTSLFTLTALGTSNPAWLLTEQEEADIVAYMRFAFRRATIF